MKQDAKYQFELTFSTMIKGGDVSSEMTVLTDEEELCVSDLQKCREELYKMLTSEGHTITGQAILINSIRLLNK